MYWGGLREFKLKMGDERDGLRLRMVATYLRGAIAAEKASLRIDVNGAWDRETALAKLAECGDIPLAGVEQPLPPARDVDLPALANRSGLPIIHDESLVTLEDARRLIDLGVADVFNLRLSKCGGMLPLLRLAECAARHGTAVQLGCMVGETSILAAAGLRFLEACPDVIWAEGCWGTRLLARDVVRRSLKFGYGGRVPRLTGFGWGLEVDEEALTTLSDPAPIRIKLG